MAVDDIIRFSVQSRMFGIRMANILHYRVVASGEPAIPDPVIVEASFVGAYRDWWLGRMVSDFEMTCFKAQKIWPLPVGDPVIEPQTGVVGTAVGNATSAQQCLKMRMYTETISKRGRGRNYFSGLPAGAMDQGNIREATYNNLQGWANAWEAHLINVPFSGEYALGVWSQTGLVFNDITEITPSAKVWTLRDRQDALCI